MEMLSSFGCDKHVFCLVTKFKHARSCLDVLSGGLDISYCMLSANELCVIECELIMSEKGLIYTEKV